MVGQRRGLLAYLKKTDIERYRALIERLRTQKVILLLKSLRGRKSMSALNFTQASFAYCNGSVL